VLEFALINSEETVMTQHQRITLCVSFLFLFGFLHVRLASAQTINDPAQNEKYGVWKVVNPQYPGIQTRARCDVDVQLNGQMHSQWYYQVRSTYKATMDYAYLVEFDSPQSHVNEMTGPFMTTAKPGDITEGFTGLYGICGEHATVKTGLHIKIKCAVPTGQDAPCFKDSDGNPIAKQDPSESQPNATASTNSAQSQPPPPPTPTVGYWWCDANASLAYPTFRSSIFQGPVDKYPAEKEYYRRFIDAVVALHPELKGRLSAGCTVGGSRAAVESWRQNTVEQYHQKIEDVNWSPN
jgi:hypothetical protein